MSDSVGTLVYSPMSELDAVNYILAVAGFQPINDLDETTVGEAQKARLWLHNTSREIQNYGLETNTDENYPLVPDSETKEILIPQNALSVDPVDRSINGVVRGGKLYDKTNHTFTWENTVLVDVIWFLPFVDLPQWAKNYITVKAARSYLFHLYGESDLFTQTAELEYMAKIVFTKELVNTQDITMLDSEPGFSVARRRRY